MRKHACELGGGCLRHAALAATTSGLPTPPCVLYRTVHAQYPSLLGVPELRQAVAKHSEVGVVWQYDSVPDGYGRKLCCQVGMAGWHVSPTVCG